MTTSPNSWRDVLPVHPAADLFPMMSSTELSDLATDIKRNGQQQPIVVWSESGSGPWQLLDGRNRLAAMEMAGIPVAPVERGDEYHPDIVVKYENNSDAVAYVLSLNVHRRHLSSEQRRELIAKVLKQTPEKSNNAIAKVVKAADKTVAAVRRDLEGRSEIPNVETRTDSKGRAQPAIKRDRRRYNDGGAQTKRTLKRAAEKLPGISKERALSDQFLRMANAVICSLVDDVNGIDVNHATPDDLATVLDDVKQAQDRLRRFRERLESRLREVSA